MREVLVDALRGERRACIGLLFIPMLIAPRRPRQPHRLLLRLPQLVQPARRAHTDFNGVGFKIAVLRLARKSANLNPVTGDDIIVVPWRSAVFDA
jgi:hypothetical protein